MHVCAGGDLGTVGDEDHLTAHGQTLQPHAHSVGHGSADALVNLIKDHCRRSALIPARGAP
jgi:hypothetical protein